MKCAPLLYLAALISTAAVADDSASLLRLYQRLHQNPELSFEESATSALLVGELPRGSFEVSSGIGKTGVVAVMRNGPGPTLLIRTDTDALPVTEATGLPYSSKKAGVMHACGHDVHMAVWIGTARRLAALRQQWSGTVVMIAQPAEELGAGAKAMLDDGLYTRFPKPTHALALHVSATLPAGMVGYTDGYAFAAVDAVDILVKGIGGHGAAPHTTKDPIVLAARIISTLQTLVSREIDPQSPGVVSVGAINGGTKRNVMPEEVRLQLTVRSYSDKTRQTLLDGIRRIVMAEAQAAGMPADRMPEITTPEVFVPATFNTSIITQQLARAFTGRFGAQRVVAVPPVMGGEDFSRFWLEDRSIESSDFRIGSVPQAVWDAAKGDATQLPSTHSPKFAPDPQPTIETGVEAMTVAALSVLAK